MTSLSQLKRIRIMVRLVLLLGVAASVAGNVLHATGGVISQIISAWSPLALLLTVDLISRVPVHTKIRARTRWVATTVIAVIAAWVSYWHMAAVASEYGETNGAQYLLPLSVDGLIVVASICLVELGGRIVTLSETHTEAVKVAPATTAVTTVVDHPATVVETPTVDRPEPVKRTRPKSLTSAEKVAKVAAKMPNATVAEIAKKAGVSTSTVTRHRPRPGDLDLPPAGPFADAMGADPRQVTEMYERMGYDASGAPVDASPSAPDAAETPAVETVNGNPVDLAEMTR